MAFLGCPRGHTIDSETRLHKAHPAPNDLLDTRPRTRAPRESDRPAAGNLGRYGVLAGAQAACRFSCSGSKRSPFFQMVKTMAAILRNGQTSHGGPDPRGQQGSIEVSERAGSGTGPSGRALEQSFQLMVVILIETAQGRLSVGTLQLPAASHAIFPAD